jgi:hypothetical protein
VFGNVQSLKKACLEDHSALDRLEEKRGLALEEKLRVINELEKTTLQE